MNGERFLVLKLEKLIFFTNCGKNSARFSEMRCSPHLHFLDLVSFSTTNASFVEAMLSHCWK